MPGTDNTQANQNNTTGSVNVVFQTYMENNEEHAGISNQQIYPQPSLVVKANKETGPAGLYLPGTKLEAKEGTSPVGTFVGTRKESGFAEDPNHPGTKDPNSRIKYERQSDGTIYVSKTILNPNTNYPGDRKEFIYTLAPSGTQSYTEIAYREDAQGKEIVGFPAGGRNYQFNVLPAKLSDNPDLFPAYGGRMLTFGDGTMNGKFAPTGAALSPAEIQAAENKGRALLKEVEMHFNLPVTFPLPQLPNNAPNEVVNPVVLKSSVDALMEQQNSTPAKWVEITPTAPAPNEFSKAKASGQHK